MSKRPIEKVLIANRGEIALRVIRACRELNLKSVAVYSTADAESLHVKFADESVCIGPPPSKESYLNMHALLSAAELTGADAVHPGYGFLSENSEFARLCKSVGLLFIGPSADVIETMGHKVRAKETVAAMGVPLLPSLKVVELSEALPSQVSRDIGYPILIKAAMGGGGRGMKIVHNERDLLSMMRLAQQESKASFGSDEIYIEKYCQSPRHIEVQILGDLHGNIVHLFERDCSIQRRHQKVIEEAPSPALSEKLRQEITQAAVNAAKAVRYSTAGTIEFLLDTDGRFYFLEMNTRIQVEHPITEMVTGRDLVRDQIRTACGEELGFKQSDLSIKGHAIEFRLLAEDPKTFSPCPGRIGLFHAPMGKGVRLESAAHGDYFVPPFYDSMIAKLICWDDTRELALVKSRSALREFLVQGIKTSIPLHQAILEESDFIEGRYTTRYLEEKKFQF